MIAGEASVTHLQPAECVHRCCWPLSSSTGTTSSPGLQLKMKNNDVCSSGNVPQGCWDMQHCKIYQVKKKKPSSVGSSDDCNRPFMPPLAQGEIY